MCLGTIVTSLFTRTNGVLMSVSFLLGNAIRKAGIRNGVSVSQVWFHGSKFSVGILSSSIAKLAGEMKRNYFTAQRGSLLLPGAATNRVVFAPSLSIRKSWKPPVWALIKTIYLPSGENDGL